MHIRLLKLLDGILGLVLNLEQGLLLLDDHGVEILHQLRQLCHLLLNLQQLLVSVLDLVQDRAGLALPGALHHGLLEDLLAAGRHVFDSGTDLIGVGIGPHDAVLSLHLALHLLTVRGLDLLELLDGGLELPVDAVDLALVAAGVGLALQLTDPLDQSSVGSHGVGGQLVELAVGARGRVGLVEGAVLQHAQLLEVLLDAIHAIGDVTDLVQDVCGVGCTEGGAALGERSHLDIVAWQVMSISPSPVGRLVAQKAQLTVSATIVLCWWLWWIVCTGWVVLLGVGVWSPSVSGDGSVSNGHRAGWPMRSIVGDGAWQRGQGLTRTGS